MKIRTKLLSSLMVITLVSSALVGCSSTSNDGSAPDSGGKAAKQVLNYSSASVVVGLNPILNTTAPDNAAHNMVS
ncbi:MAG: hypothetical protein RR782_08305, partial [Clostridium sp.]